MNTFKNPVTCMIIGPSRCGKTSFCVRLLANIDSLCRVYDFRYIFWCYSKDSAVPREQLAVVGRRIV
jgi:hypothetical protein